MKKILIILALMPVLAMAQVGIGGTENPQGALDINPQTGAAKKGLVLPKVETADTTNYRPEAGATNIVRDPAGASWTRPSVVTPYATFEKFNVSFDLTDDDGITESFSEYYNAPSVSGDVPGGTIVYDNLKDGLRIKRSQNLGNWTKAIVDATLIADSVNYRLMGGLDFKMLVASCGVTSSVGIRATDRFVYTAGQNTTFRTGKGISTGTGTWQLILASPAKDVSQGYQHGLALLENGDVYSWGSNANGRTGQKTTSGQTQRPKKVAIPGNKKVVKVEASYYNSMVLCEDSTVYMCGYNYQGRCGNGVTAGNTIEFAQVTIPGNEKVKAIAHSGAASGVITASNKVYTWGYNGYAALGIGSTTSMSSPTIVVINSAPAGESYGKLVLSNAAGALVTEDGTKMYRWGNNYLGLGTTTTSPIGVTLPAFEVGEKIVAVGVPRWRYNSFYGMSIMIATNLGNIYAAGRNNGDSASAGAGGANAGKLGVITITSGTKITNISGFTQIQDHGIYSGTQVTDITIGQHTAIITTGTNAAYGSLADYTAYGSGYNNYNMIGTSSSATRVFSSVKK
ncbi:MAG: hypothetical protein LBU22_10485 [Dysgonamonadaceae bacterium]|jgi:alpha-tubulin suppressor-like RCC1 family protein|nr:hypothetical protein [Dysgonamonadaceae bacterium]